MPLAENYLPFMRQSGGFKTNKPVTLGSTLSLGGVPMGSSFTIDTELLAASVDKFIWIAPFACKVISVREVHSVVGSTSAAVRPRKVTDVSAPGAAAGSTVKELCASIDLTATANTVVAPTVTATAADVTLAIGDKIGLDFSGTLTGLVGALTIELQRV